MNKYVKIKSDLPKLGTYPNWFMEYDNNLSFLGDVELHDIMQTRLIKERLVLNCSEVHGKIEDRTDMGWFVLNAARAINYSDLCKKYGTLYIRENGTWMTLGGNEIVEEVYSNHFPINTSADIVICENDKSSEFFWRKYLEGRFPNKSIKTINYFSTRTDEEVKEHFKGAELITFSTTFQNYEWFKKAIRNKNKNQKVIGYTHCPDRWEGAKNIYENIEIAEPNMKLRFMDGS